MVASAGLATVVPAGPAGAQPEPEPEPSAGLMVDLDHFVVAPADAGRRLTSFAPGRRLPPLALWDDAVATGRTVLQEPANTFFIQLRGDPCDGVLPRAVVSVDGEEVLDTRIGTSWGDTIHAFRGEFEPGLHEVAIRAFPGCGTVKTSYVTFGRTPSGPLTTVAWVYGTDLRLDPPGIGGVFRQGWRGDPALVLWSNGSAVAHPHVPGANGVDVIARGDVCEGNPRMEVRIDGHLVIDTEVTATRRLYRASDLADVRPWHDGTHTVAVRFPNDHRTEACDRNLKVESVAFSGLVP